MSYENNLIWFEYFYLIGYLPGEKFGYILDNLGWYCDVTNVFISQWQIQIVTWNNRN